MKRHLRGNTEPMPSASSGCLNCGAELQGAFCSRCGQRAIAPYPTLRELAGDAWHELSGWDGRFVRTISMLVRRPGALTLEVLQGRRASYISPVRLYLVASLAYFVIGAAAPNMRAPRSANPQHLVFALHLHAALFMALGVRALVNFTGSTTVAGVADVLLLSVVAAYALIAFRRVYGDTWRRVLLKSVGILILYFCAGITALLITLAWSALT